MATVKQLNDQNAIGMTDLQIKRLTQMIGAMETEFNTTNEDDEFALTDLYMNEDNELVIVCMEEMVQQGTTLDSEILDKLNETYSEAELNAIETHIKNEVSL